MPLGKLSCCLVIAAHATQALSLQSGLFWALQLAPWAADGLATTIVNHTSSTEMMWSCEVGF